MDRINNEDIHTASFRDSCPCLDLALLKYLAVGIVVVKVYKGGGGCITFDSLIPHPPPVGTFSCLSLVPPGSSGCNSAVLWQLL